MRHFSVGRPALPAGIFILISLSILVQGQTQVFTRPAVDYTVELPSPAWHVIADPDNLNRHAEFILGDRLDGYLQIRKETVEAGTTAADLARRDATSVLQFRPGYVEGKQERFVGNLSGIVANYEFTEAGKPMAGRSYYLQADSRTVYVLRFTGLRDKLTRIRNQTDSIARSFRLK